MPRTPRESFLISGKAAAFKKLTADDSFEVACDYALLQLQTEMLPNRLPGIPIDPCAGLDANAQMQGAARVIAILQTIAEIPKPATAPKRDSLHY
jgi:hypothetical protein